MLWILFFGDIWECKGQQLYTKVKVASIFTVYFLKDLGLRKLYYQEGRVYLLSIAM